MFAVGNHLNRHIVCQEYAFNRTFIFIFTAFDPRVIIEDGVCKLADRSALAGSVATMDRLIRTMVQKAEIPLEDAIRMASETPARLMGVADRKGTLQRGKDADIMILDKELNVRAVWAMGKLVEGTNKLF